MIRSGLVGMLLIVMLVGAVPFAAYAEEEKQGAGVGFDISGYYRVRYDNIFNTGSVYGEDSNWYTYFDQRLLLSPRLIINEKVSIFTEFDILRNVNWGQNYRDENPTVFVDRNPTQTGHIEDIQYENVKTPTGNVFSNDVSNTDLAQDEEVEAVQVRRVWGEVRLPIGFLKVGRMPSHFGLGLFSNSGDGYDDDYGDTYDRILFGTNVGPWWPMFSFDKIVEDTRKVADTDVNELIFTNLFREIKWGQSSQFDGGFAFAHRWQQSTQAKIYIYDLWARLLFGGFRLESEAAIIQGKMTVFDGDSVHSLEESGLPTGDGGGKITADAYINANQFWYEADSWGVGCEYGFSSPAHPNPNKEFDLDQAQNLAAAAEEAESDPDNPQNNIDFINSVVENQQAFGTHLYTYPFDQDYNMDLIIWEMLMGGAVKNGMYAKVSGYINPIDLMSIRLDVIKSWINEAGKGQDGKDADHDLGWEVDLDLAFEAADHFTFGIQGGMALVGPYFEDVYGEKDNVYTIQSRFVFDF